jgi:hypothetical protein
MKQQGRHHGGANACKIKPELPSGKIGHEDAEIPEDRSDTREKKSDIDFGTGGASQNEDDDSGVDHYRREREVHIDRLKYLGHRIESPGGETASSSPADN